MNIEIALSGEDIEKLIWIPPQHRELGNRVNFLTRNTFRIWDGVSKRCHWEFNSPLISLLNTDYFLPGKGEHLYFTRRAKKDAIQLQDVMRGNRLYTEITWAWGNKPLDKWRYAQIQHFARSLPQPLRGRDQLRVIEKLLSTPTSVKGSISKLYRVLRREASKGHPTFLEKWEREIGGLEDEAHRCKDGIPSGKRL